MKISEKINFDYKGLVENGPINIVAFGDSVTHGAVGAGEIDYETVYWNRLRKKINAVKNYMPVNVINSGIGGICAKQSLPLMQERVFDHHPDLVIICFGLNDVNGPLEEYISSLREMFEQCIEKNVDVIFMTPNMLNTYVAKDADPQFLDYAAVTAKMQNEGRMDLYMESAIKLAEGLGVEVCDCYSKWKKISETEDITMLLANRINHPTREMHELFAESLFNTIFKGAVLKTDADSNTMYQG
ncbi:MAG: SGNH/GDSL hydrolase family protein [Clostridia bacterium]|nr:SGNH/GDSL hydrolase family protein [Clostridia bacterium]